MIREFKPYDLAMVQEWMLARDLQPLRAKEISNLGFVANECAVIWIYFTNSQTVYLENLVSDPNVSAIKAARSILALIGHVIKVAEKNGYMIAEVVSRRRSIDRIAEGLGGSKLHNASVYMFER